MANGFNPPHQTSADHGGTYDRANGSGKTTLLNITGGLDEPGRGHVTNAVAYPIAPYASDYPLNNTFGG